MDPKDLGAPTATSDAAIAPSPGLVASPLLFTPQEFAAMFPRPPTWPAAMSDSEVSFSDPARDARGPQLKPADLLVELKPFPTLRRFTGVQFWFLPLTAPQTLRYIFTTLAVSASFALVWPFGAGRFETRMIVTGFVLQLCFNTVRTVMWGGFFATIARCIPAWMLLYMLYFLVSLSQELWNAAIFNAEVEDISDLLEHARRQLRQLVSFRPYSRAALAVRAHEAVLDSYLRVGNNRARVLGFVVSFGAIRSLYITLATVAFALWGVIRGLGVGFTMDGVCPG
ncbi:hypothetical protein DFJ74DRAFT_746264 [Hyaloraphidium curvatum]|nr:hypothetical protein DFJ74DRAFT_746264 [Hyaloraphidium curvatum]